MNRLSDNPTVFCGRMNGSPSRDSLNSLVFLLQKPTQHITIGQPRSIFYTRAASPTERAALETKYCYSGAKFRPKKSKVVEVQCSIMNEQMFGVCTIQYINALKNALFLWAYITLFLVTKNL